MPLLKREPDLFPADLFDLPEESRPWSVAYVRSRQEKSLARYLVQKEIPFYLPQTENKIITKVSSRSPRSGRGTSQASTDKPTSAAHAQLSSRAQRGTSQASTDKPTSAEHAPLSSRAQRGTSQASTDEPTSGAHAQLSSRAQRGTSQASTDEPTSHDLSADRLSPLASSPSPTHRLSPVASRLRISYNPLFTGYVFLRHTLEERMAVLQSDVIVTLLEVADQRGLAGELVQLRDLQAAGASLVPHPWIGVGDAVKITDGSFKGYRGLVVREHGRERLVVSIDLIRQSVAVEFEREMVSPDLFPVHQTRPEARRVGRRF